MKAAAACRSIFQRPGSLSDMGISSARSSRSLSLMTEAASWRRPTSATFSSFRGPSSRSPSAQAGWWRQAAWKTRIDCLHNPARFFLSWSGQARQFSTANQQQRQATKRHLYLVLDDQRDGFNIHKLDIDDDDDLNVGYGSAEAPLDFSDPPVLSVGPPTVHNCAQFAALGSHIIVTSHSVMEIPRRQESMPPVTLTYDTQTATLASSNILPQGLSPYKYDVAITDRNRLYMFESYTDNNDGCIGQYHRGALHWLATDPHDDYMGWGWEPLSDSSQFAWSRTSKLPDFPFEPKTITGHVVHPRTGSIFASAFGLRHRSWGTYSYGTRGGGQWKRRGDWMLPFKGHAHYDDALGAWVGLYLHSTCYDEPNTDGYLCACRIMSGWQKPKWTVCKEKVFWENPHWRHVDAKLVYMGEGSKYCLVERLLPEGANKMKYVLRLTTFSLKYGEDRKLSTTAHQPARFYKAPSYHYQFYMQAFWI